MKLFYTLVIIILFSSCKEKPEILPNTSSQLEEVIVSKIPSPEIDDMIEIFENDPNVSVADSYENPENKHYVICFMQRHSVTKKSARLSNQTQAERERISSVIDELARSYSGSVSLYDFPIYIEGLNKEAGLMSKFSGFQHQSVHPGKSEFLDSIFESGNEIYGIETSESRGTNIANVILRDNRSTYLRKYNFDNLIGESRVLVASDYFNQIGPSLKNMIQKRTVSYAYKSGYISDISFYSQIEKMLNVVNMLKSDDRYNDDSERYAAYHNYLNLEYKISSINVRNRQTVDILPIDKSSVLVLGVGHFDSSSGKLEKQPDDSPQFQKLSIEGLLEKKGLNYILVEPNSIYNSI